MDHLIVARVRRPHGVRGEVLVSVETDRPKEVFRQGRSIQLGDADGEAVGRPLVVERMRPTTGAAILKLQGIESRDDAAALRGHTMLIDAGSAAPAAPDEVHYRDLIGLSAQADGAAIGEVSDILELATGQLLVIRSPQGREVLVPLVKELIGEIDVGRGTLDLRLPEGFLEI